MLPKETQHALEQLSTVELSPATRWMKAVQLLRVAKAHPNDFRAVWEACFSNWPVQRLGPVPLWFPELDDERNSNLANWLHEQQMNFATLQRFAHEDFPEFWEKVLQRLAIVFRQPFRALVSSRAEVEQADWLPGAKLNIVESCFGAPADRAAIVFGGSDGTIESWTYGELLARVKKVAAAVRASGFSIGDRLAVVLPMTADSVAIYLGVIWAGCAVVSIADSFAPKEISNRLRIADAQGVFTYDVQVRSGKTLPMYARVVEATELPVITLPQGRGLNVELRPQDLAWNDFLNRSENGTDFLAVSDPSDVINVLFSSGTTGDPKAIPWSHTTPIKCAADGFFHQDIRPGDVTCWPTNLGWMMGPFLIFATLINRGTIALYQDAPIGPSFGRFVQDARVSMLGVIPTLVKSWRAAGDLESYDWSSIRVFSSTGESSQPDDMFYLSALAGMRPIIEYCGGTEIGGGYITATVLQPNVPSAFSTPALGLDFEILDENGCESNEGELFLVPPSIGLSTRLLNRDHHETYFADTPTSSTHRILRRHGDHFRRWPGPYWTAGGRVDDTMNLGGIKVSSAELERVMNQVAGVRETAAIAVSYQGGPEQLVVFVVCQEKLQPADLQREFNAQLRAELNPLFKVQEVRLIESLPRTASNKVMRRKLRDLITPSS